MKTQHNQSGFTIVEILIVIVIIGILAAITIVAYNGVQQKARVATIQSDLSQAVTSLGMVNAEKGAYPADLAGAALKASSGTVYQYTYTSADNSYCLTAINSNIAYMVSIANSTSTAGVCAGHVGPGSVAVTVTTLAGSGVAGFADGPGASAQFNNPYGVAVDSVGTVYAGDLNNLRIRKITLAGVVSTLAGSGTQGYVNGTGTSAQFGTTGFVAVDSAGNLYVGDGVNQRIRKITTAGVVSTLAGSGVGGYADGTGTSAQFNTPTGVAVDSVGSVYAADQYNYRIRKITAAGVVSTLAGSGVAGSANGTGTSAQFSIPFGVAVDLAGNVYVTDRGNHNIRKITAAGVVSTLAGSGVAGFVDGTGTSAQFNLPTSVAVDSAGNVYVADQANNRIRKITSAGVVTTLAGTGVAGFADGAGTSAQFSAPSGVAVDSSGTVYVGEYNNNRIRKIQ